MLTDKKFISSNPEIWGGIECSVTRVQNAFHDQFEYSGFRNIHGIVDAISRLGIKRLRFPVLWEHHETEEGLINWGDTPALLEAFEAKGIEVIAGLLHHGSGPMFTNLLDREFPVKLASYARNVAAQFPFIKYFTPVNEPLTTARFSGLYGFWYPHEKSDEAFVRILINEVKGIILSIKAIREVNPFAQLIQTEDLGKTFSSESLQYQADFENERRWLTYDLLMGRVTEVHALWPYLYRAGMCREDLDFFQNNRITPDIMGFNHYITSERFLDEETFKYPTWMHGGNQIDTYVDTEAVRVPHGQPGGLKVLLKEAWERYSLPMALTEVHLHCTREEQMRWLKDLWTQCCELKSSGLPVEALTVWSLLGAFGWNRLLTEPQGEYETGVFDIRAGMARPTALAPLVQLLANNKSPDHPLLETEGWWKRPMRFLNNEPLPPLSKQIKTQATLHGRGKLLIIGKNGTLGKAFARICIIRGIDYVLTGREDLDLGSEQSILNAIDKYSPWAVINAAGFVRVDEAEDNVDRCFDENSRGPIKLAMICRQKGLKLMSFSSDLVFDGTKNTPYIESDLPNPLNVYGQSKFEKERLIQELGPDALIIRTSAFFGPWDPYNFVHAVFNTLTEGRDFQAVDDLRISPTYVPDLVNHALDLMIDDEKSIWHLTNEGDVSWYELACEIAERTGNSKSRIKRTYIHEMNWKAKRPRYSVLKSNQGICLPTLDKAISRYLHEKEEFRVNMSV